MALIEKLKAIGDAIRGRTGTTGKMSLDEMAEMINSMEVGSDDVSTYILVDENGVEYPAVLVDEEVTLTATPNDIRLGTTAVTEEGVVTGEKEIPAYHTTEGTAVVLAGKNFAITDLGSESEFTKLQAIFCTSSTAAQKVCINTKVYNVGSSTALANVTVDTEKHIINFNIANEDSVPYIIRYFTYREEL